jgi:hypothetical protein
MKSKFLVLFFAFFFIGNMSAQDWSSKVYKYGTLYPGYVILADGKKVEGFIRYDDRYSMQNDITFFADKEDKKSKLKYSTGDLKEYMVADKLYHCIHYSGGLMAKPIKGNLVVKKGCITEYVWYDKIEGAAMIQRGPNESEEDFYNRIYPPKTVYKNQNAEEVRSVDYFALKFADKMAEFVGDNKELANKVRNKEKGYGMLQILNIIAEYNENCTPKE